jgi:hypothetical protein
MLEPHGRLKGGCCRVAIGILQVAEFRIVGFEPSQLESSAL